MKQAIAVLALLALVGCGGSPLAPTPIPTPVPTPTPVNHSGTYVGAGMTFEPSDLPPLGENYGTTTVTHSGSLLTFSDMRLTHAGGLDFTFGLGTAELDSTDHFAGGSFYNSAGCGTVTTRITGWFAGDYMNFAAVLTSRSCATIDVRGEMRR